MSVNKALKKHGSLEHGFDDSLRDETASQTLLQRFAFKARRKDCTGKNYGIPPMEKDNFSFLSKYLRTGYVCSMDTDMLHTSMQRVQW